MTILRDLHERSCDLNELITELAYYPWDSDLELVVLDKVVLTKTLHAYISGEIEAYSGAVGRSNRM